MSTPTTSATARPDTTAGGSGPRLRVKPPGRTTGYVDGAWWPRTKDLAVELPGLLDALAERVGPVETVTYNLACWPPVPRRITVGGTRVRLAGYHGQHPHTIDLVGAVRRLTLLVVPPDSAPDAAERALAASLVEVRSADELLG